MSLITSRELVRFCNYVMDLVAAGNAKYKYGEKGGKRGKTGIYYTDCSGLIEWALRDKYNTDNTVHYLNSSGLESNAVYKETMQQGETYCKAIPAGAILWKDGHVGICIGNNKCVEARNESLGIQETVISQNMANSNSANRWSKWLKMDYIDIIKEITNEVIITKGTVSNKKAYLHNNKVDIYIYFSSLVIPEGEVVIGSIPYKPKGTAFGGGAFTISGIGYRMGQLEVGATGTLYALSNLGCEGKAYMHISYLI